MCRARFPHRLSFHQSSVCLAVLLCLLHLFPPCAADTVLETWTVADQGRHPAGLSVKEGRRVEVDLSDLEPGTTVHSARLILERAPLDATRDNALLEIRIVPETPLPGQEAPPTPLRLLPPWYHAFDVTAVIRSWTRTPTAPGLFVIEQCPGWLPEKTALEICYGGKARGLPPAVHGLRTLHRAGQTFIVWKEIARLETESPLPDGPLSWGEIRRFLSDVDESRQVRYRVYRHSSLITPATVGEAELLAEVRPLSAYNIRGRSVDELIRIVRQRAIDDDELAKRLARTDYFTGYHPDMPEMDEVRLERFAIEDDRPLPDGSGLYVHHPSRPGKAYYAVVTCVDGVANLRNLSAKNSLETPVNERVGPGRPLRQGKADVTVFFDFPGTRYRYVQWAAPPLAHLPGQYFNWGVFVPRGWKSAKGRRLSVFFHDSRQRYLKPPWPHRQDTVLLSPHDAPFRSYGYGHHEALGTLRSFRQGRVRPFFARRVDAMLDWATEEFGADPATLSCGGHGPWGGTAALQYGLRRSGRIACVLADQAPDPDPASTPPEYRHYGRENERPRKTHRSRMEAVWGRSAWGLLAESGQPIWEELDLPALVRDHPRRTFPFLSLGAGSMHVTWLQETELMKAYLDTGNGFLAEFFWGSSEVLPLPSGAFAPRTDSPVLGCAPVSPLFPKFLEAQFRTGKRGYGGGSRLNTIPRWLTGPAEIVDQPRRFEITIYGERNVSYGGSARKNITLRNTREFRPRPGQRVLWQRVEIADPSRKTEGEAVVGEDGLVRIPDIEFGRPARLILEPAEP